MGPGNMGPGNMGPGEHETRGHGTREHGTRELGTREHGTRGRRYAPILKPLPALMLLSLVLDMEINSISKSESDSGGVAPTGRGRQPSRHWLIISIVH